MARLFVLPMIVTCLMTGASCWTSEKSAPPYRPTLGRLSWNFEYASCEAREFRLDVGNVLKAPLAEYRAERGNCSTTPALGDPVFDWLEELTQGPMRSTMSQAHFLGLDPLLWQGEGQYKHSQIGTAIANLSLSTSLAPTAAAWSDLSAAYIEQALLTDNPQLLVRAQAAAAKSLDVDKEFLPALFNKALVLEMLSLVPEALKAWSLYLALDSSSSWSGEAKQRLARLRRPAHLDTWRQEGQSEFLIRIQDPAMTSADLDSLVRKYPQQTREFAQLDLLHRWTIEDSAEEQGQYMEQFQKLAAALARETGDTLFDETANFIRATDEGSREMFRESYELFWKGHQALYAKDPDYPSAYRYLVQAERLQGGVKSPYRPWISFYKALAMRNQGRYGEAREQLTELQSMPQIAAYPVLRARIAWVLGLIGSGAGDLGEALEQYKVALAGFEGLGELENQATLHSYLSHSYSKLGEMGLSWHHRALALAGIPEIGNPLRKYAIFETLVMRLIREGDEAGASLMMDAYVRSAEAVGGARYKRGAYARRAAIRYSMGLPRLALEDLERAEEAKEDLGRSGLGDGRLEADMGLVMAASGQSPDPENIRFLQEAIRYYQSGEFVTLLPEALTLLGEIQARLGQSSEALHSYLSALQSLELERDSFLEEESKSAYHRRLRHAGEGALSLLVRQEGKEEAGLDLARRLHSSGMSPRSNDRFDVLTLTPVQDGYCVWWDSVENVDQFCSSSGKKQAEEAVARLISQLSVCPGERCGMEDSVLLYDLLIRPLRKGHQSPKPLLVVADGFLSWLPYAALVDRATGRLLIERAPLVYWSGLSRNGEQVVGDAVPEERRRQALIIWSGLQREATDLAKVPRAEREAQLVAASYGQPLVRSGAELEIDELARELRHFDVLHFAGHAGVAFDRQREYIYFSESEEGGRLWLEDIQRLESAPLALVYLSACRPGTEYLDLEHEPRFRVVDAFLHLGAQSVVAASWEIRDTTGQAVAAEFHKSFSVNGKVAQALASSQTGQFTERGLGDWAFLRLYQ